MNRLLCTTTMLGILLLGGCQSESDEILATPTISAVIEPANPQQFMASIGQEFIMPAHQGLLEEITQLALLVDAFEGEQSAENLIALQDQWMIVSQQWGMVEAYGNEAVQSLHGNLKTVPINPDLNESLLDSGKLLDATYLATSTPTERGLGTLEYLLFDPSGDNGVILQSYQEQATKLGYLRGVVDDLAIASESLFMIWKQEVAGFITAEDAFERVTNNMARQVKIVETYHLSTPLMRNYGKPNPKLVKAPYAHQSVHLAKANLLGIQAVFDTGYLTYLRSVGGTYQGRPLADVLQDQLTTTIESLEKIQPDLYTAIQADDGRELVTNSLIELHTFSLLLEAQTAYELGVLIDYNVNDPNY